MEHKIKKKSKCIDPRKTFAIKSILSSVFRNPLHKNKIRLFSVSFKFGFRFLYKTMTKQTVYLKNFARKSGFRLQFLRQSAFKLTPAGEVLITLFKTNKMLSKESTNVRVFLSHN